MENYLSDEKQMQMRKEGSLAHNEVALLIGDILLAENVITRERRVISETKNEGRRILKG